MTNDEDGGRYLSASKCLNLLTLLIFTALPASGQTLTVLHTFSGLVNTTNQDGANPMAGLTASGNVLCGITLNGGRFGAGTAFFLNPDGTGFNVFRVFTNAPDAGNSQADLVVSGNTLFGVTSDGGTKGTGA